MPDELNASLPIIVLSEASPGGVLERTLPKITLVAPLGGGTLDATLKKITLSASDLCGGDASLTLPLVVIDATSDTGNVYITLPMVKVTASMRMDTTGVGEVTLPIQTLSGFSAGIVDITLPKMVLVASGTTINVGSATISLPIVKLMASGFVGVVGNGLITLPIVHVSGTGHDVIGGMLNATLPKIELLAEALAQTYKCIVINLFNGVITEYSNFAFDSLIELGGVIYGVNDVGFHLLSGNLDIDANITSIIRPFLSNFGVINLKNAKSCLLSMKTSGALSVKPIYEDYVGAATNVTGVADRLIMKRVKLPMGKQGEFVSVEVGNVDGVAFNLDSITLDLDISKRRINE